MLPKYPHLTSPLQIGNVVLKNRMLATKALPHFIQGPETWPTEATIAYFANIAKNGAAVVTVKLAKGLVDRNTIRAADGKRMALYDINDPSVHNYLSMLADGIHFYGSKASVSLHTAEPGGFNISAVTQADVDAMQGEYRVPLGPEMTRQDMQDMIDHFVNICKQYKSFGFDMCNLYMTYRSSILSCALSPAVNKRTDEYGGCLENRARFPLELCAAIKAACGQDFLIEAQISGEDGPDGYTLEDTVAFAKLAEGKIDILHIRGFDGSESHPTGFNSVRELPATLRVAEAIKKSGAKIVVAPNGGYQDPELCEQFIAEGKTDMVAMGRSFICDYDYYEKILSGRGDDVVPCVRCNKCHVPSLDGPWVSICTVNPRQGIMPLLARLPEEGRGPQKVAVIGGGPAGMQAALELRAKGHSVTLFEKDETLGGQLRHADHVSFKWPLRDFKDYQIRQLYKQGVEVLLGTEATPELIAAGNYDAVIAATGGVQKTPPIPGAEAEGIFDPLSVYGNEAALGENIVVVGGSETGTETAMHLANLGRKVTVLTRQDRVAADSNPIHYREMLDEYWQEREAKGLLKAIAKAKTLSVTPTSVTYADADGAEHTLTCDNVIVCGGVKGLQAEAMAFAGTAARFFIIGDCRKPGNVHECTRQAFAAAREI